MSIFSYIMPRDFGFAPNPFRGYCTLATCKPGIRSSAHSEDWVIGFGSNDQSSSYKGKIIYIMQVQEKMSFDEYWDDIRFAGKKAHVKGSRAYQYGDNVYHKVNNIFIQEDCHHSHPNGIQNDKNYKTDTKSDAVLISQRFLYWGREAIPIPKDLKEAIYTGRNYKRFEDAKVIARIENWMNNQKECGRIGVPDHFDENFFRYPGAK